MKRGGLFNKHIFEKNSNISSETAEIVNFLFSHYKPIISQSNQSSYPTGTKNTKNRPQGFRGEVVENVDRQTDKRQKPDAYIYYKFTYEPLAQVS